MLEFTISSLKIKTEGLSDTRGVNNETVTWHHVFVFLYFLEKSQ